MAMDDSVNVALAIKTVAQAAISFMNTSALIGILSMYTSIALLQRLDKEYIYTT